VSGRPATPVPATPADGIAWVTGASSGIGLAVVQRLLAGGWTIAATARRADVLAALAAAHPGRVIAAPADITDAAALPVALAAAEAAAGRPIALAILNAGIYERDSARTGLDLGAFRAQVEVNLLGTANCVAAVLPGMIARQVGQIGIVASVAGYRGLPGTIGYSAAKAALIAMAEALKFDLDRAGVMVNLIAPGFVRTPATDRNTFPMPFLMEADAAAARLVRGLSSGRFETTFPRRFTFLLKLLRVLPYRLYFPIVARGTYSPDSSRRRRSSSSL